MLEPTELRALDARPTELDFEGFFEAEYPQLARACYLLTGVRVPQRPRGKPQVEGHSASRFEEWHYS